MKNVPLILIFFIAVLNIACNENTNDPMIGPPTEGVWIHDIDNSETASDFRVFFDLFETSTANGKFYIFLVKETPLTPVTIEYLESLEPGFYTSVQIGTDLNYDTRLNNTQLDTDGNPIMNNTSYYALVYSSELKTFSTSDKLVLSNNSIYQGKYSGTWGDNLFSSYAISGIIQSDNDIYNGPAFISANFQPAFGSTTNNGSFKMEIADNQIKSFLFQQYAPDYKGGCPGTYTGSGTVNDFVLSINYTGDDCDGHHTNGLMQLSRVWKDK